MDMHALKALVEHLQETVVKVGGLNQIEAAVEWVAKQPGGAPVSLAELHKMSGYKIAAELPAKTWPAAWQQCFEAMNGSERVGYGLITDLNEAALSRNQADRSQKATRLRNRVRYFRETFKSLVAGLELVKSSKSAQPSAPCLTFAFRHEMSTVYVNPTIERLQIAHKLVENLAEIVGEPSRHEVVYLGRGSFWVTLSEQYESVQLVVEIFGWIWENKDSLIGLVEAYTAYRNSPMRDALPDAGVKMQEEIAKEREAMLAAVAAKVRAKHPDASEEVILDTVNAMFELTAQGDRIYPSIPKDYKGKPSTGDSGEYVFDFDEIAEPLEEAKGKGPAHHLKMPDA